MKRSVAIMLAGVLLVTGAIPVLATTVNYEAEALVVSPSALQTPTATPLTSNGAYENFTGWSHDSGNSLIVNKADVILEANIPQLTITGLTANGNYMLKAWLTTPADIGDWDVDYSFISAANAADTYNASRITYSDMDNPDGAVYGGSSSTNRYILGVVQASASGEINLYLGNYRTQSTSYYLGWDRIEVSSFAQAVSTTIEAEAAVVSPVALLTPAAANSGNGAYEQYDSWNTDSGSSLIVHSGETITEGTAPALSFTGLQPSCQYAVKGWIAFPYSNTGNWTNYFSFSSAADAVGASADSVTAADLDKVYSYPNATRYSLGVVQSSAAGVINLYLGNFRAASSTFTGWDRFDLVPVVTTNTTLQAEDLVVAPTALGTPAGASAANSAYEQYATWIFDAGNSLLVNTGETITEANAPHLRISQLLPDTEYGFAAGLCWVSVATGWTWDYSFISAADAVGASARTIDSLDIQNPRGAIWVDRAVNRYMLETVVSSAEGVIDLYLGSATYGSATYWSWDSIEVFPAVTDAIYEAEYIVVSPTYLMTPTATPSTDNNYENFTGWAAEDSVNSLLINSGETIAEADVPRLRIRGLKTNRDYNVKAWLSYVRNNSDWSADYSFSSAADAVGGSPSSVSMADLDNPGGASFVYRAWNSFALGTVNSGETGEINLYLGETSYASSMYMGWDRVEVSIVLPPKGTIIMLR